MKQSQGKRSLEAYKIFPYIAWTLTVVFALFVYNIATELQDVASQLEQQTRNLERQISAGDDIDIDGYQNSRYRPGTATE